MANFSPPLPFPPQISRKTSRKKAETPPPSIPTHPQNPLHFLSPFLSFSQSFRTGFPYSVKGRNPLKPSVFKGLERIRERRRKKSLLGWMALGDVVWGGRMGEMGERGGKRGRTLQDRFLQGPQSLNYLLFYCPVVMAEAPYPHGRLYLILFPLSLPPSFPSPKFFFQPF